MAGRKSKSPKGGSKSAAADSMAELMDELWLEDDSPEECSYERKRSPKKMTSWKDYEKTVDKAPCSPGVYEFRYKDTENPVYIGCSKNLRQRLKSHRYGTQVVDEILKDEEEEMEARFVETNTKDEAREKERHRIERFEKKHGDRPRYNFNH